MTKISVGMTEICHTLPTKIGEMNQDLFTEILSRSLFYTLIHSISLYFFFRTFPLKIHKGYAQMNVGFITQISRRK